MSSQMSKTKLSKYLSYFDDLRLTTKFLVLLAVLVTGYGLIGYAYMDVLHTEEELTLINDKIRTFENGVREVELDLQSAKQFESQFYAKKYPIFLSKFDTYIISASQNLANLINLVEGEAQLGVVTKQLGQYFEEYRNKFIVVAESMLAIGLDENQGLYGLSRASAHQAEEIIKTENENTLMVSLLKMRRFEKDYLARLDESYMVKLNNEAQVFNNLVKNSTINRQAAVQILNHISEYVKNMNQILRETINLQRSQLGIKDSLKSIQPLFKQLIDMSTQLVETTRQVTHSKNQRTTLFFVTTLVATLIFFTLSLFFISRSIIKGMKKLQNTVIKVNDGDMQARALLDRGDELGELGRAFDKLLDERLHNLAEAEKQTDLLNDSVISLIRSVSSLAQDKDLAVKIPVSEDITGAIGDSLNLLSKEISNTLRAVKETSNQVASVSSVVKTQSDHVIDVANQERQEVLETAVLINDSVTSMTTIANSAQRANQQAKNTIESTQLALDTVLKSVDGINSIRSTIGETEKRIKRLGERSQEITGIVNLINSIAERTHILALNASMHAASAGEAGRGFAVVADEVQRLAENAREATSEISNLVNNIRVETNDTVTTMNVAITQVAEGSRLAEQASESMKRTQSDTNELVNSVKDIAERSLSQASASHKVLEKTKQIQDSTEQTGRELLEQTKNTDRLVQYSEDLVTSVGVFKLQGDINKHTDTIITQLPVDDLKKAI